MIENFEDLNKLDNSYIGEMYDKDELCIFINIIREHYRRIKRDNSNLKLVCSFAVIEGD